MQSKITIAVLAFITLASLLLVFLDIGLFEHTGDSNVVVETLASSILQEERSILIHLPTGHGRDSDKRYPVIYVLDGGSRDYPTAAAADVLARARVIPHAIVVGIPNTNRNRDLTPSSMLQDSDEPFEHGGGDAFLEFLERELIPHVEMRYRTTGFRVLSGYSRGGLLVVESLLRKPDLFDAHLAFSPALWRDDQVIIRRADRFFAAHSGLDTFLYMTLGEKENPKMKGGYDAMVDLLRARAPRGLHWIAEYTPEGTHQTTPDLAVPSALAMLFTGSEAAID